MHLYMYTRMQVLICACVCEQAIIYLALLATFATQPKQRRCRRRRCRRRHPLGWVLDLNWGLDSEAVDGAVAAIS